MPSSDDMNIIDTQGPDEIANASTIQIDFLNGEEYWGEYINLASEDFFNQYLDGIPGEHKIAVEVSNTQNSIEIEFEISGLCVRRMRRKMIFSPEEKIVNHELWKMQRDLQDHNFGKKIFSNSYKLYKEIGIHKIYLCANINIGSYAWAKYGFVPTRDSWIELKEIIQLRLKHLTIRAPLRQYIEGLLEKNNPYDIWKISDIHEEYEGSTVGKKLLIGEGISISWNGVFDLLNIRSVDKLESYLGIR